MVSWTRLLPWLGSALGMSACQLVAGLTERTEGTADASPGDAGECTPGEHECMDDTHAQACNGSGHWGDVTACKFVCGPDGCGGDCTPRTSECEGSGVHSCLGDGTWGTTTSCPGGFCNGAGLCGVCMAGSKQCLGNAVQTCKSDGTWGSPSSCSNETPLCNAAVCRSAGPSCNGLPATCGPIGNQSCCSANVVPGGTFNRSNDVASPATVSDFRLDNYQVTVGRFRKFVAAYSQTMTPAGAGRNPNNPVDLGWDPSWNSSLPASATDLVAALKCDPNIVTWTDTPQDNENRPINCISWYEAYAFCIWDGGRLSTEAEYNYAAAGGAEQRVYPWSNPPESTEIDRKRASYNGPYGCLGDILSECSVGDLVFVGTKSPPGDGKWGQSELAGTIWQWVLDWHLGLYPVPCNNCSAMRSDTNWRVQRGGSFSNGESLLLTTVRSHGFPGDRNNEFGTRCARAP